jgi:hypothetical protein
MAIVARGRRYVGDISDVISAYDTAALSSPDVMDLSQRVVQAIPPDSVFAPGGALDLGQNMGANIPMPGTTTWIILGLVGVVALLLLVKK